MKILKPGKDEMRKFVCPWCGCIFVAAENELEKDGVFGTYSTICPNLECGEHIESHGEPYEEPTQSDKERLIKLLREWRRSRSEEFPVSCANYLIANGVTFKEDANGQN